MISLFLVVLIIGASLAQETRPSPHTLTLPRTWKLGVEESVAVTLYDWSYRSQMIRARVLVQYCTCETRPRYTENCMNETVFSKNVVQAFPGQAAILKLKMPTHKEVVDGKFYIVIESLTGDMTVFYPKQRIYFYTNARGMLMIKTDKPIYKPSQEVKFCVVAMDALTRPRSADVSVVIRDNRRRMVAQWKSADVSEDGYWCGKMPLADEPPLGDYYITVTENSMRGTCSWHGFYKSEVCNFKVDEFVLPKFEVTVTGPKFLTKADDTIEGDLSAEYVFGEPVEGMAVVKFILESKGRRETFEFYEIRQELVDGKMNFSVLTEEYKRILRYRYDPFCVSTRISIVAQVEEMGRGLMYNSTYSFPLEAATVKFAFDDEYMPRVFRPGLTYPIRVTATNPDGTPANADFNIEVSINNGDQVLYKPTLPRKTSSLRGGWSYDIEIPDNANCLRIVVTPIFEDFLCEKVQLCKSPAPAYSPSRSYLKLHGHRANLMAGQRLNVKASSNRKMDKLHCLTTSGGRLLEKNTYFVNGSMDHTFQVIVTRDHSPRFQVLCYFAREDGEVVGDILEKDIKCQLRSTGLLFRRRGAKARISPDKYVTPGANLDVVVRSRPNTPVLVSIYDKSLTLLADSCESGKQNSVCDKKDSMAYNTVKDLNTNCNTEIRTQCCPQQCQEPQKIDINKILQYLGVYIRTNMYLPTAPTIVSPTTLPSPIDFRGRPGPDRIADIVTKEDVVEEVEEDSGVRRFFPESMFFGIVETGEDGFGKLETEAPDTITTWIGEALAFSKVFGLGFSSQTSLRVFKPFFVSLELPYSINFGETLTLKPLIFNFLNSDHLVTIDIVLDENLSIIGRYRVLIPVPAGSSAHTEIMIHARGIGRLPIRVTASYLDNPGDSVEKLLFVKPGCKKFEKVKTEFVRQEESHKELDFEFTLPDCVIPGSDVGTIVITGDVMSPPNLENLLVVPTGCGEQNLVKTMTNYLVANYLRKTKQLEDHIWAKIRVHLMKGYQQELTYQTFDGGFAIWPTTKPSLWLTAFALKSFANIDVFLEDTSFIDGSVMRSAFNWIRGKQEKNGCFPRVGVVHNYRLMDNSASMTAYALVALHYYNEVETSDNLVNSTNQAKKCLSDYWSDNEMRRKECTYTLALSTYAMMLRDSRNTLTQTLLRRLEGEIVTSRQYPGGCYLCNSCTAETSSDDEDCDSQINNEDNVITSDCVETTGYALLALLEANDNTYTPCLANWLLKQQNSRGSFGSSQDTIVAMEALAKFAGSTFSKTLNMEILVDFSDRSETVILTEANRYTRHELKLSSMPQTVQVGVNGTGNAIVQAVTTYHGCNCCDSENCFSLEVESKPTEPDSEDGKRIMGIDFSYSCARQSNMAILDVQLPSGCVFEKYETGKAKVNIQRNEVKGDNVVFYMDSVPRDDAHLEVHCETRFEVQDLKPVPVTIYDYYKPNERVTKYLEFN